MTRPRRPFTRPALAALFAIGFLGALVSCSPEEPDRRETEASTRTVAAGTWEQEDQAGRRAMCEGIAVFGADWMTDQMEKGLTGSAAYTMYPAAAVEYIIEQCGGEGLWPDWATDAPIPE